MIVPRRFQGSTCTAAYLWPTSSGTLSTSAGALDAACAAFVPYKTADSVAASNRCGAFGYYEGRSLQNGYGKTSAYLSGIFDVSDEVTGYAQVLANRSKDESSSQTHYYIGEGAFTVYDPDLGLVTAQRIFLPSEVGGIKNIEYDEKSWNLNAACAASCSTAAPTGMRVCRCCATTSPRDVRACLLMRSATTTLARCLAIGSMAPRSASSTTTGCSRRAVSRCINSSPPWW
ncbi:hypothetical protein [Xanthomonas fragariae]|uniref:hypothetical protein n=1 Tax=Xanthomonas fragariae TaxID=48664 RepID=UPI0022AA47B2|nr:hypothetical protein [Xanthomonas fragariae]WAT14439.1 hypothetical protein OZ429_15690 [Xanthomonas fragariae]